MIREVFYELAAEAVEILPGRMRRRLASSLKGWYLTGLWAGR